MEKELDELDGLLSTVMPPPSVTLTFDLLTPKEHIYKPKCICDQNWMKFQSLIFSSTGWAIHISWSKCCLCVSGC